MSSLHQLYEARNVAQAEIDGILSDIADDGAIDECQRHWLRVFGGLVDLAVLAIAKRGADPFAAGLDDE